MVVCIIKVVYDSKFTFNSYNAGDVDYTLASRDRLLNIVPHKHLDFISNLEWVIDVSTTFSPGCLIAVHTGLDPTINALMEHKPFANPILWDNGNKGRLTSFSGKHSVHKMHQNL